MDFVVKWWKLRRKILHRRESWKEEISNLLFFILPSLRWWFECYSEKFWRNSSSFENYLCKYRMMNPKLTNYGQKKWIDSTNESRFREISNLVFLLFRKYYRMRKCLKNQTKSEIDEIPSKNYGFIPCEAKYTNGFMIEDKNFHQVEPTCMFFFAYK